MNVNDDDESQLDLDDLKNLIEGGNVPKKPKVRKSEIVWNTHVLETSSDICNQYDDNSAEIKSDTPAKSFFFKFTIANTIFIVQGGKERDDLECFFIVRFF